jgi:hypothetical protein
VVVVVVVVGVVVVRWGLRGLVLLLGGSIVVENVIAGSRLRYLTSIVAVT